MARIPLGDGPTVRFPSGSSPEPRALDPGAPARALLAGGTPDFGKAGYDAATASLGQLGRAFERDQAIADEREKQTARLAEERKADEFTLDFTRRMDEMFQAHPAEGGKGFTDSVLAEFQDRARQQTENADPRIRDWVQTKYADLEKRFGLAAFDLEKRALVDWRTDNFNAAVTLKANRVRVNDAELEPARAEIADLVQSAGLPERLHPTLTRRADQLLSVQYLEGINSRNPDRAKAELESGRFDGVLEANQKDHLLDKADTAIRMRQREQDALAREAAREAKAALASDKADYTLTLQDHIASLSRGGPGDPGFSEKTVRALYGNQAERVLRQVATAEASGKVADGIRLSSASDDQRSLVDIAALRATPGAEKGELVVADLKEKAILAKQQAIAKDPAGYALWADPKLSTALASQDAGERRAGLARLDQVQVELGVPEHARRVIPEAEAAAIVAQFHNTAPEKMADQLQALSTRYGDKWDRAFADLVRAKLPPEAIVLGTLDRPQDAPVRQQMADAVRVKRQALKDGLPADVKEADINNAVAKEMADFDKTLTAAGGGVDRLAQLRNAAELLALKKAGQGTAPVKAAREAVSELYLDRYDIDGTWRAPKGASGAVRQQIGQVITALGPSDLQLLPVGPGEPKTLEPAQRLEAQLAAARRGIWVTNERDDGLVLLYPNKNPVRRADGSRVEFRFRDIYAPIGLEAVPGGSAVVTPGIGEAAPGMVQP